jgi:DnaJ-class molecular chaperone
MRTASIVAGAFVLASAIQGVPADHGITADIACETARELVRLQAAKPDKPTGDKCQNCDGKGKVRSGDGISVFTCPVCSGTGKKPKAAHPCKSGKCPL